MCCCWHIVYKVPLLSCWDPHLIAEIPIQSKVDPLLLPWLSPWPSSEIPNTMLPLPQTPTNPKDLWHYIIALQDPWMTPEISNHPSVFMLDINHWWISDKSIPLCLPPLYSFCPQVHSISITSPTPLCSSLFPLYHPCLCIPVFIDICPHVITMILLSLAYSLLTPFLSFLVSCSFVPSPWLSQAIPAV